MKDKVVILGAGESGTGAALLAKKKGFDVFVSDSGKIKDRYREELAGEGIAFEEGIHSEERMLDATLIVKSPGIPDDGPIMRSAAARSVPVVDEIEFASRYTDAKIIAITGTNGKTTTTMLTGHLMQEGGINVALAGNIGVSLARKVAKEVHDWYVLEVSSFQLEGIETFKPDMGVLLNITPDHLNRYDNTLQNYVNAKFQLVTNMSREQNFIWFADDPTIAKEMNSRSVAARSIPVSLNADANASVYYDGTEMVFDFEEQFRIRPSDTTLKGPHNIINTMCAVTAARLAGVSVADIRAGLKTFVNAPHRLERVGTINDVDFVNDSKATNVDAVLYALGSFDKPLVWIAGGVDKGNDYSMVRPEVEKKVRALICLGKDNEKLKHAFGDIIPVKETQDIDELVTMALDVARPGDVVLLSPACASFDLFLNYEDRGNQFKAAVEKKRKELSTES